MWLGLVLLLAQIADWDDWLRNLIVLVFTNEASELNSFKKIHKILKWKRNALKWKVFFIGQLFICFWCFWMKIEKCVATLLQPKRSGVRSRALLVEEWCYFHIRFLESEIMPNPKWFSQSQTMNCQEKEIV